MIDGRQKLLKAALNNVPFDGWSDVVLTAASKEVGLSAAEGKCLFPGGTDDLIDAFALYADDEMISRLAADGSTRDSLGVGRFVSTALRKRFEALENHKEALRRSLGYLALPTHAALGVKLSYRTVDTIWKAAGIHSTDFSFYTRRITLGGIMASTTLFWLTDESEGSEATWAFMDRRFKDHANFTKFKDSLSEMVSPLARAKRRMSG